MPDLDDELAELRTRLRETVHQPDLNKVIERSRQRRTRRRTQLGAVAAVLVVGAAIPVLRTTLQPVPDGQVAASAIETSTQTTQPAAIRPPVRHFLQEVDFADALHGFALRAKCTDAQATDCTLDLLVTEDRGSHWEPRGLPAEVARNPLDLVHRLYVFGSRSLVIGEVSPPGPNRFYSADAGRHWVRVDPIAEPSTAAIPDGALLDSSCTSNTEPNCDLKLFAIEPTSGQALYLKNQPPFKNLRAASNVPMAGGWWAAGQDPASGRWSLAVSRDDGRTWSTAGLPSWQRNTWQVTMAMHNATVYVAVNGEAEQVKNGLVAIFRSRDGANTWEQTFPTQDSYEPASISGSLIAGADGRLIVVTEGGGVYGSTDGGKHFEVMPNAGFTGYVIRTRAGYLAGTSISVSNVYKLSSDGVGWKEITIG